LIADLPRAKLSELLAKFGTELRGDARRWAERLGEAYGDLYHVDCVALAAGIEHGIVDELRSSTSSSEPKASLLNRLSRQLETKTALPVYLARWSVECWAVALGIVPESERLLIVKIERFVPMVDRAVVAGVIDDQARDGLIDEAKSCGIGAPEAHAFLVQYAARHSCRLENGNPVSPPPDPMWRIGPEALAAGAERAEPATASIPSAGLERMAKPTASHETQAPQVQPGKARSDGRSQLGYPAVPDAQSAQPQPLAVHCRSTPLPSAFLGCRLPGRSRGSRRVDYMLDPARTASSA